MSIIKIYFYFDIHFYFGKLLSLPLFTLFDERFLLFSSIFFELLLFAILHSSGYSIIIIIELVLKITKIVKILPVSYRKMSGKNKIKISGSLDNIFSTSNIFMTIYWEIIAEVCLIILIQYFYALLLLFSSRKQKQ